jgi:hypothetical protein
MYRKEKLPQVVGRGLYHYGQMIKHLLELKPKKRLGTLLGHKGCTDFKLYQSQRYSYLKNIWPHLPKQTLKPSWPMLIQKQLRGQFMPHLRDNGWMIFTDCKKANLCVCG